MVNRIDIDLSVKKVTNLLDIFDELNIKELSFVRLHAPEYNPFSFENYRVLKRLLNSGHELGYHSEIVDQSIIWKENAEACLLRDLRVLGEMFDYKVKSVASHGGMTGYNNLDFGKIERLKTMICCMKLMIKRPNLTCSRNLFIFQIQNGPNGNAIIMVNY